MKGAYLIYSLTMPNNNSWNGRWSGEGNNYERVQNLGRKQSDHDHMNEMDGKSFYYDFGDGWGARVSVRKATAEEARRSRAYTKGFCGYEWMIRSIKKHGKIISDD